MKRVAAATVLIALVLLLAPAIVRGVVLLVVLLVSISAALALIGRRIWRAGASPVPWLVSLGISAVIVAPLEAIRHQTSTWAGVVGGLFGWLLLTLILRFAVLLSDWLRRRRNEFGADSL